MGVEGETFLLTRYCFGLISLGIYALRLCLVCVVDVRVHPRSSVGILEEALDLTVDLCKALFLQKWEDFLQMSTFSVQVTRTPPYKPGDLSRSGIMPVSGPCIDS